MSDADVRTREGEVRGASTTQIVVLAAVVIVVVAAAFLLARGVSGSGTVETGDVPGLSEASTTERGDAEGEQPGGAVPASGGRLPRLVDLGSTTCIPCKAMAPILEELRETCAGRFDVVFIDVRQDRDAARRYGVRVIPTQVFEDPNGTELHRHQGFYSREEILATWRELGFDFLEE